MRMELLVVIAMLLAGGPRWLSASEAEMPPAHFTAEGLEIEGGSLGKFVLAYPGLLDAQHQPRHRLVEKAPHEKTATLKYEGGVQLELGLTEGRLTVKVASAPADLKYLAFGLQIPIAFNQGGSWGVGPQRGEFPKEKPAKPQLFQGHGPGLQLTNYEGKTLEILAPPYSWLELTDNREWHWAIYHFRTTAPFDAGRQELVFQLKLSAGMGKVQPLVDEFGQAAREEWPGKAKQISELKSEAAAEVPARARREKEPGRLNLDASGGLVGTKAKLHLKATGFFHIEQQGERTYLVSPEGNAFFHLGLCSMGPNEDYTLVKGREAAFAWLPPREGDLATAYKPDSGGTVVSFHLANMIRKWGEPYTSHGYTALMIERARSWGFNSGGAFSALEERARTAAKFPFVAHLPLAPWEGIPRIEGIQEVFDPFDEKTRAKVEENLARRLPERRDDPLLLGYFITNEPIYENIPHLVPTLKGTQACKRRLVQWLEEKYQTPEAFATAWKLPGQTFAAALDAVLPVETAAAKEDLRAFTGVFLEAYFSLIEQSFRRHDPHHLQLGSRLMPGTIKNEQLCRIMGQYVDVMSFNYYTDGIDRGLLRKIHGWTGGRPLLLSEFYWSAAKESGLSGGREVGTQRERGLAYRNYVEQSAALGFVVGIEWFTLVDQAVTGRSFQGFNGERANTGIYSVADRPWTGMLEEAAKTNRRIYEVYLGEQAPFAWDDPRFVNQP